jgi:hypothetical protein
MASEVGIGNSALIKIGKATIVSFDEGSPGANFINNRYTDCRDELLRMHPWNFAMARAALARLAEVPAFEYSYFYQLPTDWMRTIGAFDNDTGKGHLDYQEEDGMLATNAESVYLKYVYKVTDPNAMTPDFREALAYRLAIDGAISLASSNTMHDRMKLRFDDALITAKSTDALANRATPLPRGSWVTRRSRAQSSWPM